MYYIYKLKQHMRSNRIRKFCCDLANANGIELNLYDDYHERFFSGPVSGCTIGPNKINASSNIAHDMLLHELCHMLVVEPEYRHMMMNDTVSSYRSIALAKGKSIYRTEGTTFALQHLLLMSIGESTSIVSTIYSGQLGTPKHALKDAWIENANTIFESIKKVQAKPISKIYHNMYNTEYHMSNKSVFNKPISNKPLIVVRVAKEYELDISYDVATFKKDNFYIGDRKLDHSYVYGWTYENN